MIFVGDVHGEWVALQQKLQRLGVRDEIIVQVGDFGVGFGGATGRARERAALDTLDRFLARTGNTLLTIRGNHDDPAYFRQCVWGYERIRPVPDYTVETLDGRAILFVGGAISIDRRQRRAGRDYWPDEGFHLNEGALERADLNNLWGVVTHSAPAAAPPATPALSSPLVRTYAWGEPRLLDDLEAERRDLTRLYEAVVRRSRPAHWIYGHFHGRATAAVDGTRFVMLDVLELQSI